MLNLPAQDCAEAGVTGFCLRWSHRLYLFSQIYFSQILKIRQTKSQQDLVDSISGGTDAEGFA